MPVWWPEQTGPNQMTDATIFDAEGLRDLRQRLHRERQARVGILRNPNQPPKPPPRRASLTGRWVNMRSSRRAQTETNPPQADDLVAGPAAAVVDNGALPRGPRVAQAAPDANTVRVGENGRVVSVDIDSLMAAVDHHVDVRTADSRNGRTPFAADIRPDITPQRRATDPGRRNATQTSILSAEAWLDEPETRHIVRAHEPVAKVPAYERHPRSRSRLRSVMRLVLSMLGGMVLAIMVLLAILGPPP